MSASDIKDVIQIGIVTADLDRAMRLWTDKYGVGPWEVTVFDKSVVSDWEVDGRPADFEMRIGTTRVGNMAFELIEPTRGESVWSESLARHGGADHIHHLMCTYGTADIETAMDDFRKKGVQVAQRGHMSRAGISWAFLDAEAELGCMLEFVQMPGGPPGSRR